MLAAGVMVTPTVRLVRQLAEGGMGSVWVADHLALGTQVAVKFMSESLTASPGAMQRFTREATAAANVKSPHIVQVFDHGVSPSGEPFIVMELLEGRDLRDHLFEREVLPLPEVSKLLTQVCRALGKAHAAGIVHRDIKPDNLFLTDSDGDMFVKLLDFGVAKQENADAVMRMTSTGTMVGTPYYMSPEQSLGLKTLDFHTDLWSLGVVMYQCCVGSLPFGGDTVGALFIAIDRAEFAPPSLLQPDLPPALDGWFKRALSRDPNGRFASAKEMAQSFDAAVEGRELPSSMSALAVAPRTGSLPEIAPGAPNAGAPVEKAASTFDGRSSTFDEQRPKPQRSATPVLAGMVVVLGGIAAYLAFGRKPETPLVAPLPTAVVSAASAVAERPSDTTTTASAAPTIAPADGPTLTPAAADSAAASASAAGGKGAPVAPASGRRVDPKVGPVTTGGPKPAKTVDRGF